MAKQHSHRLVSYTRKIARSHNIPKKKNQLLNILYYCYRRCGGGGGDGGGCWCWICVSTPIHQTHTDFSFVLFSCCCTFLFFFFFLFFVVVLCTKRINLYAAYTRIQQVYDVSVPYACFWLVYACTQPQSEQWAVLCAHRDRIALNRFPMNISVSIQCVTIIMIAMLPSR